MIREILSVLSIVAFGIYFLGGVNDRGSFEDAVASAEMVQGRFAFAEPRQTPLRGAEEIEMEGFRLQPVAEFSLEALVLGAKGYTNDPQSDLMPVDLALGWGKMATSDYLSRMTVSQRGRFYHWRHSRDSGVNDGIVISSSSNMHMIPATDDIAAILEEVNAGDVVRISGRLVDIRDDHGGVWRTSRTRSDTGAGACEVILVRGIEIVHTAGG